MIYLITFQVKFTVDGIIDTIRRTGTHFIHCFLLQHSAGSSSLVSNKTFHQNSEDIVNIPLLRSQVFYLIPYYWVYNLTLVHECFL